MSFNGLISENHLFLICPTDSGESVLFKRFKGQVFFYTALGACFKWDIETQENLINLIKKRNVRHIVLLMKMTNTFFTNKLKVKYNIANYSVEKTLQFIEDTIPEHLEYLDKTISKQRILATTYLEHQKRRLLDTLNLGKLINNEKISVTSLLYSETENRFLKTENLKERMKLFGAISIN